MRQSKHWHWAVCGGNFHIVNSLIEAGAFINAKDKVSNWMLMSYYPFLCVLVCLSTFYYEIGKLRAISVLIDMVVPSVSLSLFYYFKYCRWDWYVNVFPLVLVLVWLSLSLLSLWIKLILSSVFENIFSCHITDATVNDMIWPGPTIILHHY